MRASTIAERIFRLSFWKLWNTVRVCSVLCCSEHHNSSFQHACVHQIIRNKMKIRIAHTARAHATRSAHGALALDSDYYIFFICEYGTVHLPLLQHLTGTCPFIPYFFRSLLPWRYTRLEHAHTSCTHRDTHDTRTYSMYIWIYIYRHLHKSQRTLYVTQHYTIYTRNRPT